MVDWLVRHAEAELGADMGMFTVGGSSAGGNLALATCLRGHVNGRVKGVVTFYAPVSWSSLEWSESGGDGKCLCLWWLI